MSSDHPSRLKEVRYLVTSAGARLDETTNGLDHAAAGVDFADVMLGLLARQYQLWAAILWDPLTWKPAIAPFLMRGLIDGVITLSWIADHPDSAGSFKAFSAGRLKLQAELRANLASKVTNSVDLQAEAARWSQESDDELWREVSPVLLSNWNGRDIRTMADEAGLKDLYDLHYGPLSSICHAEWLPLKRHFMVPCTETLHLPHWLPVLIPDRLLNRDSPRLATTLMWMSVKFTFDALSIRYDDEAWEELESGVREAVEALSA